MTDKTMTLEPCPFCGCKDNLGRVYSGTHSEYYVQCFDCDARGPVHADDNEACGAWSKRHLSQPAERGEAVALPMATAPRDGRMLRLLVKFTEHATDDAEEAWTIGSHVADDRDDDLWAFAGWCWTHDHFTEGKGEPIGWLPFHAAALSQQAAQPEWPSSALPPLPFPAKLKMGNGTAKEDHLYDADQMRQYARAAMQSVRPPVVAEKGSNFCPHGRLWSDMCYDDDCQRDEQFSDETENTRGYVCLKCGHIPTESELDAKHCPKCDLRPPFGVVSDEDVERACETDFGKYAWHALSYEQKSEMRRRQRGALESYASRHAPTKE